MEIKDPGRSIIEIQKMVWDEKNEEERRLLQRLIAALGFLKSVEDYNHSLDEMLKCTKRGATK